MSNEEDGTLNKIREAIRTLTHYTGVVRSDEPLSKGEFYDVARALKEALDDIDRRLEKLERKKR